MSTKKHVEVAQEESLPWYALATTLFVPFILKISHLRTRGPLGATNRAFHGSLEMNASFRYMRLQKAKFGTKPNLADTVTLKNVCGG